MWIMACRTELDKQAFDLAVTMLSSLLTIRPDCVDALRIRGLCFEKLNEVAPSRPKLPISSFFSY